MTRGALAALLMMVSSAAFAQQTYTGFVGGAFLRFSTNNVEVPDVVGLDVLDADTALEAAGLDTGNVTMRCSAEPADEVLEQDPAAGVFVEEGSLVDLVTSDGMMCAYDLTGIPVGWYTISNVLANNYFVELMRIEATSGGGDWAYWLPGAPQIGSNLQLDMALITAEASGSATWARWAPGTQPGNSANLQLNMRDALNADFQ